MNYKVKVKTGNLISTGQQVCFHLPVPALFDSHEAAEGAINRFGVCLIKDDDQTVSVYIIDKEVLDVVDVIYWDEWWKYKCVISKDTFPDVAIPKNNEDYEPCALYFETLFRMFAPPSDESPLHQFTLTHISSTIIQGDNPDGV